MTKSRLTKQETERLWNLRSLRSAMCDAGRWTRDTYNMCAAQLDNEDEVRRLVAKENGRIWL